MDKMLVVVVDAEGARMVEGLEFEPAVTTLALASEDPASWREMACCWPRYRTPLVAERLEDLGWQSANSEMLWEQLLLHSNCLVIDLLRKCVALGGADVEFERDITYRLTGVEDEAEYPVAVSLPPWWETHNYYVLDGDGWQPEPIAVSPQASRDVLFGLPLYEGLSTRLLEAVHNPNWQKADAEHDRGRRYRFTVEVHRDWLMTPHPLLAGRTPRECMHGAHDWLERLIHAQRRRHAAGLDMVALPAGICGGESSPVSREELILHFDLCRVLIEAGWDWCVCHVAPASFSGSVKKKSIWPLRQSRKGRRRRERRLLTAHLQQIGQRWLSESYEGGHSPRVIMEYSRRRVPRAYSAPVVGMQELEESRVQQHAESCGCPLCDAMDHGLLGTAFELLDGYHLELDDEFAFSLCEHKSDWQKQQAEFADWTLGFQAKGESAELPEPQLWDEG
ncbi:MAG: hypothetical protein NXI32_10500 [bacterium]|nr:hypothetical protein [bacterium]